MQIKEIGLFIPQRLQLWQATLSEFYLPLEMDNVGLISQGSYDKYQR